MKKFVSFLIAAVLCVSVFSLTGCAVQAPTEEENGGSLEGVEFTPKTGEMYAGTKEGKTAIKIAYATGYKDAWIRQAARAFLLDPIGKDYYFVLTGDSEITTGVSSKLESGRGLSDIYMILASPWYSYAANDKLASLDDLYEMQIPGEDGKVIDKIRGTWKTYGKTTNRGEEHFYSFHWNENVTGIVYNKTMFDKYGWKVPTTVTELKELCEQIVKDGEVPFVYPGNVGGGYWDFVGTNWWLQYSGIDKLNEFMGFASPEVYNPDIEPGLGKKNMLKTFSDLIVENRTKYTLRGSASKDHLKAQVSFAQREAAMIPDGVWIEKESGQVITDEIRMMRVPYVDGAKTDANGVINVNYSGQPDMSIVPKEADNVEGAKKFLAFMCRDDMLKQYTNLTGAPRPFDYDISECKTTPFVKSCLDIWASSVTWFENSTSKLWTANKLGKFQTTNPYTTLLANADTITASSWCSSEYTAVKNSWDDFVSSVGGI